MEILLILIIVIIFGAVLTGNADLSHRVGLRTSARVPFYNGPIECRLLIYPLYPAPHGDESGDVAADAGARDGKQDGEQ